MFQGRATEALQLYGEVFPEFQRDSEVRGDDGRVQQARVSFAGHRLFVFDSPMPHDFDFTPSVSLFVTFTDSEALDACFASLAEDGKVLMPLGDYGFSPRYGWLQDRFGVSWQLSQA